MAETVHLFLKSNGNDIKGESTQTSAGREDSIEVLFLDFNVMTARDAASGMASGRRQYKPLAIRKRIDKASPLILKSLSNNEVIEGIFKFYRPSVEGDGTTEQFYTIEIKKGRVASQRLLLPDTDSATSSSLAPMEEISFTFATIVMTYTDGGITHQDSWGEGGGHA